jgi:hypothetical protein
MLTWCRVNEEVRMRMPLLHVLGAEVGAPVPGGDDDVHLEVVGAQAHALGAVEAHRADIGRSSLFSRTTARCASLRVIPVVGHRHSRMCAERNSRSVCRRGGRSPCPGRSCRRARPRTRPCRNAGCGSAHAPWPRARAPAPRRTRSAVTIGHRHRARACGRPDRRPPAGRPRRARAGTPPPRSPAGGYCRSRPAAWGARGHSAGRGIAP